MFAMTTPNSESHNRAPQSVIIVRLILKINCLHSSVMQVRLWVTQMLVTVVSPLRREAKHQCEEKGGNESPQFRFFGRVVVQFLHHHFRHVNMDTRCLLLLVILVDCRNIFQHLYLIFLSVVTMQWHHMVGAHMASVLSKKEKACHFPLLRLEINL